MLDITAADGDVGAFSRATGRTTAGAEDGGTGRRRYRRYQYDLIAPHCGRSVAEVGAGLGEFAAQFTGLDRHVLTDVDPDAVAMMKKVFAERDEVEVCELDLEANPRLDRPVESVIAINVVEHFEDDAGALAALARLVVPGGTVIVWVPGYQALYSEFDRRVGHFRRYTPGTVRDAAGRAGLRVELARPVNLLGGIAWWAAVRKGGTVRNKQSLVTWYDRLVVPATRVFDRLLPVPFGQSILCVARTPAPTSGNVSPQ